MKNKYKKTKKIIKNKIIRKIRKLIHDFLYIIYTTYLILF